MRLAGAVLASVLLFSAYITFVQLPQERRAGERSKAEIESLRSHEVELRTLLERSRSRAEGLVNWGGGARLLALPALARGPTHPTVSIQLRWDQPLLPILIDHTPTAAGNVAEQAIVISIRRVEDGDTAWTLRTSVEQVWDPVSRALTLLVPTSKIRDGAYRLEIEGASATRPEYSAPFEIRRFRNP